MTISVIQQKDPTSPFLLCCICNLPEAGTTQCMRKLQTYNEIRLFFCCRDLLYLSNLSNVG